MCLPLLLITINSIRSWSTKKMFDYQSRDNISGKYFENKCFSIPVCVLLICN